MKDYKIGMCCFPAQHAVLRSKNKDWLARNQNNVSTRRLLCVDVVQSRNRPLIDCNLFSPSYWWTICKTKITNSKCWISSLLQTLLNCQLFYYIFVFYWSMLLIITFLCCYRSQCQPLWSRITPWCIMFTGL